MGQYRARAEMRHGTRRLPNQCATQVQSHSVTVHPTGALGFIIVCLRADAASRIVAAPLGELANANVPLEGLFSAGEVAACKDFLAAARTSTERVVGIQTFLLQHLRPPTDHFASRAARHLINDPTTQMHSLAARLDFSARHVARVFSTMFGISPKRFARLARFQKIVSGRRNGLTWAQVAHDCGLTDQAHLVKEFHGIVGESPTEFFAHELPTGAAGLDEANLIIQHAARPTEHSLRGRPPFP